MWGVMYLTGYVTARGRNRDGALGLTIPNREIHDIFVAQVKEWFMEDTICKQRGKVEELCAALESGDGETAQNALNSILKRGISIRDTAVRKPKKENFYHGFLMGLLMSASGWSVHSNQEDGDGYSDVHVEIDEKDTAFVIEVKYAEDGDFDAGCKEALAQIGTLHYLEGLEGLGYGTIYAYGIAFYKKRCRVER